MDVETTPKAHHASEHTPSHDSPTKRPSEAAGHLRRPATKHRADLCDHESAEWAGTQAPHIGSSALWTNQRNAELATLENLIGEAVSNDTTRSSENQY